MTVARSAALAVAACSAMTSSLTSAPLARQRVERVAGIDLPHVRQGRYPVPEASDLLPERGRLGEEGPRARVGQDPFDLLGRRRLVDRHGHRARGPDGVVDQRPLVPGVRHQRDPVSGLDARRDQSLGHRRHLVLELARGHVVPGPGGILAAEHHRLRLFGGPAEHDVGEVRGRGNLRQGREAELTHGFSPTTWLLAGTTLRGTGRRFRVRSSVARGLPWWYASPRGERRARPRGRAGPAADGADALICLGDLLLFLDYADHGQGIFADLFGAEAARSVRRAAHRHAVRRGQGVLPQPVRLAGGEPG